MAKIIVVWTSQHGFCFFALLDSKCFADSQIFSFARKHQAYLDHLGLFFGKAARSDKEIGADRV